ncbi:MAG: DegT/DnrJ/EryC1/StrS family aminotransferase [Planctomycetia bacterium]|nr:DegT/DnrJ/EryC1/StrS family aminotransferase [Planctomycetia bacterium]
MSKLALLGGTKAANALVSWPVYDQNDEKALFDALHSGHWFRNAGTKNREFEQKFAAFSEAKFGLTVANGTVALEIPLLTLNLQPTDEVIVPPYTFYSTAASVVNAGGKPVFSDIDSDSYNMNLDQLETLITERTKAIIPVHFGGYPVDMDRLNAIAAKYSLFVIEDSAHAHGARYKGRRIGSLANAGTFSFQASKNLTSGEGGFITTNDEELHLKMFARHTCGRLPDRPWYQHFGPGSNLRLSEFQAALLLSQFDRIESQFNERQQNGRILEEWLKQSPYFEAVQTQTEWAQDRAYHLLMFRFVPGIEGVSREKFIEALEAEGVPAMAGYPIPLYKQPAFENFMPPIGQKPYSELNYPNVEKCCQETVWISQNALLGSKKSSEQIIDALQKIIDNADELRTN